ncbi:hypothetical protein F4818DRAFT_420216 [Hypoxylon cercidicola]|nr:hypothetical protein F4818DRAFT_420216 [Hypoxylon cercidicola]
MSTQSKEHELLDGPMGQRTSLTRSAKRTLGKRESDEVVPNSQKLPTSSETKNKSSKPVATATVPPNRSSAHSDKKSRPQARSSNESKMELPRTPVSLLGAAVKDLSKYRRKRPTAHLTTRAASSPIKAPATQYRSVATPKSLSAQRSGDLKVAIKTYSRAMRATRPAKVTTAARATTATRTISAARTTTSNGTNPALTPNNHQKTPRSEGRQDPYDFPSDSEAEYQARHKFESMRKPYVSRSFPRSDPCTPARISADAEVILLDKVSSSETPGSHITPDSHRTSHIGRSTRGRFPPGSIVISLDDSSSNEKPASPSPFSNPRLDSVDDSPPSRHAPARNQPNDKIILPLLRSPSYSAESISKEALRKLELLPTSRAAERDRGMERTKQYVLAGSPSEETTDKFLDIINTRPFLAANGRSSPLSVVSKTTSTLIAEQLMEMYVPPSNQELAALMSSSPGKQFAGYDEASDLNTSRLNGTTKESLETLTRMSPEVLRNQGTDRSSNMNGNGTPQSTRVLRSRSTAKPTQRVQSVSRVTGGGKGNTPIPPKETRPKPAGDLFNRSRAELARKDDKDALPVKTNIVVELPALSGNQQSQYDVISPTGVDDTHPTAIPKSFQEINGATSTIGEQSQESDTEALNYVLRRSPQWLNGITGLDPDSEAEKNSDVATQVSTPPPIFPAKTSIPKSLAHTPSKARPGPEGRRSPKSPLLPQAVPLVPAKEWYREDPEGATRPDVIPRPKEELTQKQQPQQQEFLSTIGLTNGDVAVDAQSLSEEGRREVRKSPPTDDAPVENPSGHKRQKVSHSQEEQQQDASAPGGRRKSRVRKRNAGRKARNKLKLAGHCPNALSPGA